MKTKKTTLFLIKWILDSIAIVISRQHKANSFQIGQISSFCAYGNLPPQSVFLANFIEEQFLYIGPASIHRWMDAMLINLEMFLVADDRYAKTAYKNRMHL